jgi:hypothetical protein
MIKPFHTALSDAMARTGDDLKTVAAGSGVPADRLESALSAARDPLDLSDAKSVARYFGSSLAGFLEAPELTAQLEIADLYSQLPEPLKRRFQASRRAAPRSSDRSDRGSP